MKRVSTRFPNLLQSFSAHKATGKLPGATNSAWPEAREPDPLPARAPVLKLRKNRPPFRGADMLEALRAKVWVVLHWVRKVAALFGPVAEERVVFYQANWYFPHLRHPRTFNEKVCHRKLFRPAPMSEILADKYAVREYVSRRGYPEILNEILLLTDNPEEINFDKLPRQFAVKATHGSGWNILVRDKGNVSQREVIDQCRLWLAKSYGASHREFYYHKIKPAILIERFLSDGRRGVPLDYKFHMFHGKCRLIMVDYDRFSCHTRTIYNERWEPLPFRIKYPQGVVECRPATLESMLEISEVLARGMDFARIDLYSPGEGRIFFGEITLTPGAGFARFLPNPEWDHRLGSLW
jgi:hypothetical protein